MLLIVCRRNSILHLRSLSSSAVSKQQQQRQSCRTYSLLAVTRQKQQQQQRLGLFPPNARKGRCFSTTQGVTTTVLTKQEDEFEETISTPATDHKRTSLMGAYFDLAKARLSALVVSTTAAGFIAGNGGIAVTGGMVDHPYLVFPCCILGTALCSSSAAAWNQIIEVDRDKCMKRTQKRPLVATDTSPVSVDHAKIVATAWGVTGIATLGYGCDIVTMSLGASNIALYAGLYTWLKPRSYYNTWVGAVVGAIPPIMGYTAATVAGSSSGVDISTLLFHNDLETYATALYLGGTLYYWQLPHFFALSFMHRQDYQRGGFKMLPVVEMEQQEQHEQQQQLSNNNRSDDIMESHDNKTTATTTINNYDKTANVILRNATYLSTMPIFATMTGITNGSTMFLLEGIVLNGYFVYVSANFYNHRTNANARKVFLTSLWYLPSILMLYLLHSKTFDQEQENSSSILDLSKYIHTIRDCGRTLCIHEKAIETASHTTIITMDNKNHHHHDDDDTKLTVSNEKQQIQPIGDQACPIVLGKKAAAQKKPMSNTMENVTE